jgi:hypothetical protein
VIRDSFDLRPLLDAKRAGGSEYCTTICHDTFPLFALSFATENELLDSLLDRDDTVRNGRTQP